MPNASAGLIAALKASLANSAAGWAVTSVRETSTVRVASVTGSVAGSASGTISEGSGTLTGSTTGSTNSTSSTKEITTIALKATAPALSLIYETSYVDGAFTEAWIQIDGASLRTTDSALNTTIMGLATAYCSARDTALTTVLNATPADPLAIPSDLRTALLATLGDFGDGWSVQSRSEQVVRAGDGHRLVTVSLISTTVRAAVGSRIPANVTYLVKLGLGGQVVEATVMIGATAWRTTDATLHTTIMALGDAFVTAKQSALTASFELGPQVFED